MLTSAQRVAPRSHRIGTLRLAAAGALFMGIFYFLCWSGAALRIVPVSHMYLQLFSDAPLPSTAMLIEGAASSIVSVDEGVS